MKKLFLLSFFALAIFACSRKTLPASEVIISNPTPEATVKNNSETATSKEVITGKSIYINRCGRCHALKPIEKYSKEEWNGILKDMIPRANLNEAEAKEVTAFVLANSKKN